MKQFRLWRGHVFALLGILFFGSVVLSPVLSAATRTPKLYLQPLTQSLAVNATVSVPIRVDTAGQPANVASVTITYPSNLLKFVSVSYSGSAFGGAVKEDVSTAGTIKLTRYVTPPGNVANGDVLFATLSFK